MIDQFTKKVSEMQTLINVLNFEIFLITRSKTWKNGITVNVFEVNEPFHMVKKLKGKPKVSGFLYSPAPRWKQKL